MICLVENASRDVEAVLDEILTALDPDGTFRRDLGAAELLAKISGPLGGEATRIAAEMRQRVTTAARAHVLLVPLGWGVTNLPVESLGRACDLLESGDQGSAEVVLTELWDEPRMRRVAARAQGIGTADPELRQVGWHRRRRLNKAVAHHVNGAYEAAVPLVLAQIEGIVIDVTEGQKFFSKSPVQKADVVDPTRLEGIVSGLEAVRTVFCTSESMTGALGRLSRHGILHGRELGYDTELISAKVWSLLDVVVEWALPVGRALAEKRRQVRLAEHAGSQAVDERGGRVDRREFSETRDVLGMLCAAQMGWHQRLGQFRDDLVPGVYSIQDFVRRGLAPDTVVHTSISADGQIFWTWRRSISGWVLAEAVEHNEDGTFTEWFYGAPNPPTGPPMDHNCGWTNGVHPDWRG